MYKRIAIGIGSAALLGTCARVALPSMLADGDGYNYGSYRQLVYETQPIRVGNSLPALTVYQPDGASIALTSLWAERPVVIETGSATCPVFVEGDLSMDELATRYEDVANFALVYVREAHPGTWFSHHRALADKLQAAMDLSGHVARPVVVDDLDGSLHRMLGGAPNGGFVIGTDGVVAHATFWNEPSKLQATLQQVLANGGKGAGVRGVEDWCPIPDHLGALELAAYNLRIIEKSGPDALWDFLVNGPMRRGPDPGTLCRANRSW